MGFVNHFILTYGLSYGLYAVQWLTRGADAAIRTAGNRLASTAPHVGLRASVEPRASTAIATACTERLCWASWSLSGLSQNFGGNDLNFGSGLNRSSRRLSLNHGSNRWVDCWAGHSTQRRHGTDEIA